MKRPAAAALASRMAITAVARDLFDLRVPSPADSHLRDPPVVQVAPSLRGPEAEPGEAPQIRGALDEEPVAVEGRRVDD